MVQVVIADNHPIVRTGLLLMLENTDDLRIVEECRNGDELLEVLALNKYDLAIVDVHMPGKDALELIAHCKLNYASMPVIVFTMNDDPYHMARLLRAGVAAFISKQSAPAEIIFVLNQVIKKRRYISHKQKNILADIMLEGEKKSLSDLTAREFQIFKEIAVGNDYRSISLKLSVSKNTISNHRNNILKKLQLKNNSELTRYAIIEGILK